MGGTTKVFVLIITIASLYFLYMYQKDDEEISESVDDSLSVSSI